MELPSFLVTSLQQPEPVQKPKEEEIGKQYPVNSSHFSPYKNYIKHSAFAKRTTLHPALSLDPLQRAKEVLTDMHYSFGRVHPVQPLLSSFHAGKLAPGCQSGKRLCEGESEVTSSTAACSAAL